MYVGTRSADPDAEIVLELRATGELVTGADQEQRCSILERVLP